MVYQRKRTRFLSGLLLIALLIALLPNRCTIYADTLRYYDYTKKSNVSYTGKQVAYYYNGQKLQLSYPGIISDNGVALVDYQELFVNELGIQAKADGNKITFTNGTTTVQLTIGSTKGLVNNATKTMSVAPLKIKFADGVDRILVPSRFVAEAFGYTYVWTSSTSSVKITKTFHLTIGTQNIAYNNSIYSLKVNDKKVTLDMPVFYHQGSILAPLKNVSEALGCQYKESEQEFQVLKDGISINLKQDEKAIYINDRQFVMDIAPMLIKDNDTKKSSMYISLEFIADMLGYALSYDDALKQYTLKETEDKQSDRLTALLNSLPAITKEPRLEPVKTYFEWAGTNEATGTSSRQITKIAGYAIENADVIEIDGITSDDINAIADSGFLIFDMKKITSQTSAEFFSDYSNPYLQYVLFTQLSSGAKITCMIPETTSWTIINKQGYVQIIFTKQDINVEDLLLSSVSIIEEPAYPEGHIIIPLPKQIDAAKVSDQDLYADQKFQIKLSGNHMDYYETAPILNPYYAVKEYSVSYDKASDCTIITFLTSHVCAYQYEVKDGYLAIKVARPNELYSKIVLLDAGHGGIDPGAVINKTKEKDLNYKIINTYAKDLFKNSDIKVYFTRNSDIKIDLYERADLASEIGADLFISLHMNTNNNKSVYGTEVFYSAINNTKTNSGLNSSILAKSLAKSVSTALETKNRGATDSSFVVVKYNTVPAVLIETGFMSNANELDRLTDSGYQKKIAQAIYNTVEQIFNDYPTGR